MKCKNCGKEFIKKCSAQRHCSAVCRYRYSVIHNYANYLKKREKLFEEEFNCGREPELPNNYSVCTQLQGGNQLQTVVRTGLYIPYQQFDDQDFIGVKKIKVCVFCIWNKHCKKDKENHLYPVGCKSYLYNTQVDRKKYRKREKPRYDFNEIYKKNKKKVLVPE